MEQKGTKKEQGYDATRVNLETNKLIKARHTSICVDCLPDGLCAQRVFRLSRIAHASRRSMIYPLGLSIVDSVAIPPAYSQRAWTLRNNLTCTTLTTHPHSLIYKFILVLSHSFSLDAITTPKQSETIIPSLHALSVRLFWPISVRC